MNTAIRVEADGATISHCNINMSADGEMELAPMTLDDLARLYHHDGVTQLVALMKVVAGDDQFVEGTMTLLLTQVFDGLFDKLSADLKGTEETLQKQRIETGDLIETQYRTAEAGAAAFAKLNDKYKSLPKSVVQFFYDLERGEL